MNRLFPRAVAMVIGLAALAGAASAQLWTPSAPSPLTTNRALDFVRSYQAYRLNQTEFRALVRRIPRGEWWTVQTPAIIELPTPDKGMRRFEIIETPIMTAALERKIPSKTYQLRGIDDPSAIGCLDTGVNGLHGLVLNGSTSFAIEPAWQGSMSDFAVFWRSENLYPRMSNCTLIEAVQEPEPIESPVDGPGDTLRTYRLAINGTGEYTQFHGGTVAQGQAAIVTTVNRVNQVYIRDLCARMTIVLNNPYTNPNTDPFSNFSPFAMLNENQTVCDSLVGAANYEIGHVVSTGGGGVAQLACLALNGAEARGVTGTPTPIGDPFDIDYVAHEMGHQFGANHTFNSEAGGCGGGNRNPGTAYEPGSASTIMGYAGLCNPEDLQFNSDDYFHIISIVEIYNIITARPGTTSATGNTTPTVSVGANLTIPQNTPIRLAATGSDANGDTLTYCWEQFDLGSATTAPTQYSTGPLCRSYDPSTTGNVRFVPPISNVINNTVNNYDKVPISNRNFTWRCTVRDNRAGGGGYATATKTLTVSGAAFQVTAPNAAVSWPGGSTQTVTWTVGGGSVAPNVNILLSTNGGANYATGGTIMVLANTPNDGSQTITVPNVATNQARIIVEAVGNVFYDMSNVNFTITALPVISNLSPSSIPAQSPQFTLTVNGSGFAPGAIVRWNGGNRTTTFVNANQLTATIPASDVLYTGTATVTVFMSGVGTSNGVTFNITPGPVTTVNPSSFSVDSGFQLGGTLSSLFTVDNDALAVLNDEGVTNGQVTITGTSPFQQIVQMQLLIHHRAARSDITYFYDALNQTNTTWENLAVGVMPTTFTGLTLTVPQANNPTKYVRTTDRQMQARVRWIPQADLDAGDGWGQFVDRFVWTVQP